jgi:hypothetical protein
LRKRTEASKLSRSACTPSARRRIQLNVRTRILALPLLALATAGCGSAEETVRTEDSGLSVSAAGWKTDFSRHVVPLDQFQSGGPGKDGIPAIDEPRFVPVSRMDVVEPKEPVIELVVRGRARAYPIQILIWHEIVNDEVSGIPVAVTFCPLCNTSLVFERRVRGRTLDFGTTGNLRNSDLVMYDRQTESWWQQFGGAGLVGHYAGARLRVLPSRIVSWKQFRQSIRARSFYRARRVILRLTARTRMRATTKSRAARSSPPLTRTMIAFRPRNGSSSCSAAARRSLCPSPRSASAASFESVLRVTG